MVAFSKVFHKTKRLIPIGIAIAVGLAVLYGVCFLHSPVLQYSSDANQLMHSSSVSTVCGSAEIGQSFVVDTDNIAAISFYVSGFTKEKQLGPVVFRLYSAANPEPVIIKELDVTNAMPGWYFQVDFDEIWQIEGSHLVFTLQNAHVESGCTLILGGTYWDSYSDGQLITGQQPQVGDLSFVTYSRLSLGQSLRLGIGTILSHGRLLLLLLFSLFLSAATIWPFFRGVDADELIPLAATIVSSPLLAALVIVVTDWSGLRFSPYLMVALCSFVWLGSLALPKPNPPLKRSLNIRALSLILVSCFILVVQMSFVERMAVPSYLDSVHHVALAKEIVQSLSLPTNLPLEGGDSPFIYHFAIHALTAGVTLLGNQVGTLGTILLIEGPVLLLWYALGVYCLTRLVGCDHWCSLGGMILSTFAFSMPTFALNWGKYPLLLALSTFPGVLSLLIMSLKNKTRLAAGVVVGLLIAANILAHTRMLFVWSIVAFLVLAVTCGRFRNVEETVRTLVPYCAGPFVFIGLWLLPRWLSRFHFQKQIFLVNGVTTADETGRAFSTLYRFDNPELFWITMLVVGFLIMKDKKLALRAYIAFAIILLTVLSLIPIGSIPGERLIDAPFAHTALALPVVVGLAIVVEHIQHLSRRLAGLPSWLVPLFVSVTAVTVVTARQGAPGLNYQLASRHDMEAMHWIEESTSPSAIVGVAAGPWENGQVVGVDGGYWVQALTGRKTTLPSLLYGFADAHTQMITSERALDVDTTLRTQGDICTLGIDYVYVGDNAESFEFPAIQSSPYLVLAYRSGPVAIFEVQGCEEQ